ncbi:MAG: hypothetical protein AB1641_04740 [Thermodesulfobacteriota bacterium]
MKKKKTPARTDRWDFMTGMAFSLEAHLKGLPTPLKFNTSKEAAIYYLEAILKKFPRPEDAEDDPEGFAVWTMASTLLDALAGPDLCREE